MRKAFKVATVFTGTAACAAAFAPAAGAATTAKTQQVEPATSHWNCTVGPRTKATVLWWPTSANHGPTCVGGNNLNGSPTRLFNIYNSYCPGNNWGHIDTSGPYSYAIHPGETRHTLTHRDVFTVFISSWSGSDTCAT